MVFTIAPKRIKHLEVNFTKEGQNLYIDTYKTLLKEIKEYLSKFKSLFPHR